MDFWLDLLGDLIVAAIIAFLPSLYKRAKKKSEEQKRKKPYHRIGGVTLKSKNKMQINTIVLSWT